MTDIVKSLSPTEVSAEIANAARIAAAAVNAASSKTFIFYAGFDGTNNIESNLAVAGDTQSTAIGALSRAIPPSTINSTSKYYAGVGTTYGNRVRPPIFHSETRTQLR